jgi:hypothetical protein
MVTTVKSRPNHYDTLGLEPGASSEKIARAFAAKIALGARPLAAATQIYAAYETLRDPERRRAYDASIGVGAKREPLQWPATRAGWNGGAFMVAASAQPAPRRAIEKAALPPRKPSPDARPTRAQELLDRLEEQRRPQSAPAQAAARPSSDHALLEAVEERLGGREERAPQWNRTAVAIGTLFAGVALVGAWAGVNAGKHVEAAQAKRSVTLALPRAKPVAAAETSLPEGSQVVADAEPEWRARAAATVRRTWRAPAAQQIAPTADEAALDAVSPEAAAAQSEPARVVAASMPLPNTVVARTIERIGYACGEVVSTTAGEAPGVYTVTCTSGQSYQAKPVHGRYRFRRLSSR